jgi:hypothetical protein
MTDQLQNCLYYIKLDPLLQAIGISKKQRCNILVRRRCNALKVEDIALIARALRAAGIDDVMRYADGVTLPPETVTTQEVQS